MLFGLSNISVSFQRYIDKILAKKLDIVVIVNLDNILIFIDKVDHIDAIWSVFNQLNKHFLYANLKKCHFHQD